MKQFIITVAGVFLGLMLFLVGLPLLLIASAAGSANQEPTVAANSVLLIDMRQPIVDQKPASPFANINGSGIAVVDVVRKLEAAETDGRVKGLMIRAPEGGMAPAHAEELRDAINRFKASGKFVIAHSQGFDFPTLTNYVTVAPATELWMQGTGDFAATGMVSETTFLGGAFEKFGITPEFEQFYEYKNAANVYTQRDYTAAHREATESYLGSVFDVFSTLVAQDRKITPDAFKAVLDRAPISAAEAVEAKLVTKLGQPEEAMDAALEKAGDGSEFLDINEYKPKAPTAGEVIALVGGEGSIITGAAQDSIFGGEALMVGDEQAAAIREAADDDEVKAIVYRVSSGGGSATASDQIWAAVRYAQSKNKPVVVSMGAYAASGGYYVATHANEIVAQPTTLTGSIGVLGGKFAINEALNRYTGANSATIAVGGPYTTAFASADRFTNSQRVAFREAMERIYVEFTGKVAAGRKMPLERVLEIAKGRVWTGAQGKTIGLVDQTGGLRTAIERAKVLAKIDPKATVRIRTWPKEQSPFEALSALFGTSAETVRAAALLSAAVNHPQVSALVRAAAQGDGRVQMVEPMTAR